MEDYETGEALLAKKLKRDDSSTCQADMRWAIEQILKYYGHQSWRPEDACAAARLFYDTVRGAA